MGLIDSSSGFSGTSVSIMEHLHDVYLRTPVLSFGLRRPVCDTYSSQKDQNLIINEAFLTAYALQNTSFHIPIECKKKSYLNDLIWNPKIDYQTSAVIASLLDTLTMPARIFPNQNGNPKIGPAFGCGVDMEAICQLTIGNGRAGRLGHVVAALEAPLVSPRSKEENKDGLKLAEASYASFNRELSPKDLDTESESIIFRGPRKKQSKSCNLIDTLCPTSIARKCLAETSNPLGLSCSKRIMIVPLPLPLPKTYPIQMLKSALSFVTGSEVSLLARFGCTKSYRNVLSRLKRSFINVVRSGQCQVLMSHWCLVKDQTNLVVDWIADQEESIKVTE